MRFMMLMIPNISEEEWQPDAEGVAAMGRYNEELSKAGVLLSLDGLHPASEGARVSFTGGRAQVADGPFTEAKELVGGYWIIDVSSKAEAVQWASRCPANDGNVIEVRRVFELSDFPADVQAAVPELGL
ncbi:MAG: YciI family protein [Solirubrobacteraceae bacterium]